MRESLSIRALHYEKEPFDYKCVKYALPYIFRDAMRLLLDSENVEFKELFS